MKAGEELEFALGLMWSARSPVALEFTVLGKTLDRSGVDGEPDGSVRLT